MLNKLIDRLLSPTPRHFKRLVRLCAVMASIGTSLTLVGDSMPDSIKEIGKYMIVVGAVGAGISQSAREDDTPVKE